MPLSPELLAAALALFAAQAVICAVFSAWLAR